MKGGDVVLIHALRALKAAGQLDDAQIIVIMTGDEESSRRAAGPWCARIFSISPSAAMWALAFENAMGKTGTVARRGAIGWLLEVQGVTGHSSMIFPR